MSKIFKQIMYYFHWIIILSIITIPLFPISILKYLFIVSFILPFIWFIFSGCPINNYESKGIKIMDIVVIILKQFGVNKKIEERARYLFYFILMLIGFLSIIRLSNYYCNNNLLLNILNNW